MLPITFPIQCKQVLSAVAYSCSLYRFGEYSMCVWTSTCQKNTACLPQTLPLSAAAFTDSPAGAGTMYGSPSAEGVFLVILLQYQSHFLAYEMHLQKDVTGSQGANSVSYKQVAR